MNNNFIITEDTIVAVDFDQASVFVDACFLLSILDFNDGAKRAKAGSLLQKLQDESAKELVISNQVLTEVVHNIFKRRIRNVLFIKHKWDKREWEPSDNELKVLGDIETATALKRILVNEGLEYKLDELVQTGDFYYSIDKLVKLLKKKLPFKRDGLTQYYKESVDEYNKLVSDVKKLGFDLRIGAIDEGASDFVLEFTSEYQLEPYDASHLVIAEQEGCQYLITFDGDFSNNYYKQGYNTVKIINTAS